MAGNGSVAFTEVVFVLDESLFGKDLDLKCVA